MAKREQLLAVSGTESVIGAGVTVRGDLIGEGDISIDGRIHGNIKAHGSLIIGVNAIIDGDIEASNISIAGQLRGNTVSEGEVSILETGRVEGDIKAHTLAISSGALFIGGCQMTNPEAKQIHEAKSQANPED